MNKPSALFYIFDGLNLIAKPGIRKFVFIPLVLNIMLFTGLLFGVNHFYHVFNTWFSAHLPHWLTWLSYIIWLLFFVSFFIVAIYTFTTLANIISAPFNSFLSEKVELYLTGTAPTSRTLWENIQDIPRMIGRQLIILCYYIPIALLLFISFFVPAIHIITAVIWVIFNAWFLALQYFDYVADNHRISLKVMRQKMKSHRVTSLGFGMGVLLFTMIPVLNFLAMPAAIAAGTKLWLEQMEEG